MVLESQAPWVFESQGIAVVRQAPVASRSMEEFLQHFCFDSVEAAVKDESPMTAMLCAMAHHGAWDVHLPWDAGRALSGLEWLWLLDVAGCLVW